MKLKVPDFPSTDKRSPEETNRKLTEVTVCTSHQQENSQLVSQQFFFLRVGNQTEFDACDRLYSAHLPEADWLLPPSSMNKCASKVMVYRGWWKTLPQDLAHPCRPLKSQRSRTWRFPLTHQLGNGCMERVAVLAQVE